MTWIITEPMTQLGFAVRGNREACWGIVTKARCVYTRLHFYCAPSFEYVCVEMRSDAIWLFGQCSSANYSLGILYLEGGLLAPPDGVVDSDPQLQLQITSCCLTYLHEDRLRAKISSRSLLHYRVCF